MMRGGILLECLVSLALGLSVLGATLHIFISWRQQVSNWQQTLQSERDLLHASQILNHAIARAHLSSCGQAGTELQRWNLSPQPDGPGEGVIINKTQAGLHIIVPTLEHEQALLAPTLKGARELRLDSHGLHTGDIVILNNCQQEVWVPVAAVPNAKSVQLSQTLPIGFKSAQLGVYKRYTYYLAEDPKGKSHLYVATLSRRPQPIADGITGLSVTVGEQKLGEALHYVSVDAVQDWRRVNTLSLDWQGAGGAQLHTLLLVRPGYGR